MYRIHTAGPNSPRIPGLTRARERRGTYILAGRNEAARERRIDTLRAAFRAAEVAA